MHGLRVRVALRIDESTLANISILSYCILCSCKSMKYHLHYQLEYQVSLSRFWITVDFVKIFGVLDKWDHKFLIYCTVIKKN
jgi:hypothetical protein